MSLVVKIKNYKLQNTKYKIQKSWQLARRQEDKMHKGKIQEDKIQNTNYKIQNTKLYIPYTLIPLYLIYLFLIPDTLFHS